MSSRSRHNRIEYNISGFSPIFSPHQRRRIQNETNTHRGYSPIATANDVLRKSMSVPVKSTSPDISSNVLYGHVKDECEHEDDEMKSSMFQTVCNAINLLLGVGVLSFPFALKISGWIIGLGILLSLTILTNYTGKLIGQMIDRIRQKHNNPDMMVGFEDMGLEAFGDRGSRFISCVFIIELGSACALYLVLMGDNLHAIFPHTAEIWLILICVLLILPSVWLKNLSLLSYFSILGLISSLFLFCVIIIQGASLPKESTGSSTGSFIKPSPTVLYTSLDQWPLCFGLIMVGFAGHAVFPSLYTGMKDTKQYPSTLNITYGVVGLVYTLLAALGYLMYGADTKQEVTLNLDRSSILSQVALWLIVINPSTKFALTLHPVATAVENKLLDVAESQGFTYLEKHDRLFTLVVRTTLTFFITIVAVSLPYFARITSFVGAFCSFTVSGIFPLLCFEKLFLKTISSWQLWLNRSLAFFCIIGAVWGTAATFYTTTS